MVVKVLNIDVYEILNACYI